MVTPGIERALGIVHVADDAPVEDLGMDGGCGEADAHTAVYRNSRRRSGRLMH